MSLVSLMKGVKFRGNEIILRKELSQLDILALNGVSIISRVLGDYVIVAGYVAILFGRSRVTEDIDVIINSSSVTINNIIKLYDELNATGFWVFNAVSPETGFEILKNGLAIRVAKKESIIPNLEVKIAKEPLEFEALRKKVRVILNDRELYISPIELNIAYKLYLGSQKDIEDAVYLYCVFQENIKTNVLASYMRRLGIDLEKIGDILRC